MSRPHKTIRVAPSGFHARANAAQVLSAWRAGSNTPETTGLPHITAHGANGKSELVWGNSRIILTEDDRKRLLYELCSPFDPLERQIAAMLRPTGG